MSPAAARMLRAARDETGRRAAAGGPPSALEADRLVALLEADPAGRAVLDAATGSEPPSDPTPEERGPRAERRRRRDRALAAIDELLLAGELAPDGPGRVVLPGFGASTWRALDALRAGAGGAEAAWAAALVRDPFADLGDAAPAVAEGPPPDRRLVDLAREVHAHEAARQDMRDALIRAEAAATRTAARGPAESLASIRDDMAALGAALAATDAAVAALWRAGLARAGG